MSRRGTVGVSPIHYHCALQYHDSAIIPSSEQWLVNPARELSEHCQGVVHTLSCIPSHLRSVIMSSPKRHHVISEASSCHLQSVVMSSPKPSRSIARPSSSLVAVSQLLFHYVGSVMTSSHHYRHLPLNRLQALFQIASEMSCVASSRSEGQ